jgi:hypothetical protein
MGIQESFESKYSQELVGLLLDYNTRYAAVVNAAELYLEAIDRGQEWRGNLLANMRQACRIARQPPRQT